MDRFGFLFDIKDTLIGLKNRSKNLNQNITWKIRKTFASKYNCWRFLPQWQLVNEETILFVKYWAIKIRHFDNKKKDRNSTLNLFQIFIKDPNIERLLIKSLSKHCQKFKDKFTAGAWVNLTLLAPQKTIYWKCNFLRFLRSAPSAIDPKEYWMIVAHICYVWENWIAVDSISAGCVYKCDECWKAQHNWMWFEYTPT